MSFVRTKGANEQHVTASAYVACAYACVASENQSYEMVANGAHSAELALTITYPTSASGIIVLLKTSKRIAIFELTSCFRLRVLATKFVVNGI